jgi:hypothetical protein
MGVLISAFPQPERDLPDAVHAQLDALDIELSDGNWREHVGELFLGAVPEDIPAAQILTAAQDYVRYHDGKTGLGETTLWHVGIAQKVVALATVAVSLGEDMVVGRAG